MQIKGEEEFFVSIESKRDLSQPLEFQESSVFNFVYLILPIVFHVLLFSYYLRFSFQY